MNVITNRPEAPSKTTARSASLTPRWPSSDIACFTPRCWRPKLPAKTNERDNFKKKVAGKEASKTAKARRQRSRLHLPLQRVLLLQRLLPHRPRCLCPTIAFFLLRQSRLLSLSGDRLVIPDLEMNNEDDVILSFSENGANLWKYLKTRNDFFQPCLSIKTIRLRIYWIDPVFVFLLPSVSQFCITGSLIKKPDT